MLKVIKKYEVEIVEVDTEIIISVFPKPLATHVQIARHAVPAKTFQRMSDADRAATIRNSVNRCLTMLQEKEHEIN